MAAESLTDRVVTLRPWRDGDAAAIVECVDGEPEIARWLDRMPQPYALEDARAYIAGSEERSFAITDAETGRVLGSIGLGPLEDGVGEVGYWVRRDTRGHGVATRALVLLSRWALGLEGVARVQLRAGAENAPSRRVAERAGFQLEGVLRSAHWNPRMRCRQDWALYSLLPGDLP
jgi:RimJ/RimL family protein N-acetyltransferase